MSYTSYSYLLIFLGSVFLCYTLSPKKYKWVVLLVSSYIFYMINSGKLAVFLVITTAAVYFAGVFINKINDGFALAKKGLEKEDRKKLKANIAWQKKAVVVSAVLFVFGILLVLKYSGFFLHTAKFLAHLVHIRAHLPKLKFILPLGISYYTLQAAGYIIDVYRGKYRATENFGKLALFLSFFPQIVEGPIGRYDLLADNLYEGHPFDYDRTAFALQRIVWGLFKKMVIADRANILVSEVFGNAGQIFGQRDTFGGRALHPANLRRVFGLYGYCNRQRAAVRRYNVGKLLPPVFLKIGKRILAAVAHNPRRVA